MVLAAWWVTLVAAGVVVIAVAIGLVLGVRRNAHVSQGGAPLARAERVRALPGFAKAVRRRRSGLAAVIAVGAAAVLVGGFAAARPMSSETIRPQQHNRDVMLCLDVSGSMTYVDSEIIETFLNLLPGFEGERIGLTVFNSSPVQAFPLTDDYEFVKEHLESMQEGFDSYDSDPEHYAGTLNGPGSSLIGDGLAACAMRFDHLEDERSRSIIFATDNELFGAPILTLDEGAALAAQSGIRVFTIDPLTPDHSDSSAELQQATESTGGQYFSLADQASIAGIIDAVRSEEAKALDGQVRVVWHDSPDLVLLLLVVLVFGFLALVWRVKL